jgi:hypothetical protein
MPVLKHSFLIHQTNHNIWWSALLNKNCKNIVNMVDICNKSSRSKLRISPTYLVTGHAFTPAISIRYIEYLAVVGCNITIVVIGITHWVGDWLGKIAA